MPKLNIVEREVVCGFNDKYLVYESDDGYYRYDLDAGEKVKLDVAEGANDIAFYHGKLYYSVNVNQEFGVDDYDLYACDVEANEAELIHEIRHIPGYGSDWYMDVKFMNDRLFLTGLEGDEKKLFMMDLAGGDYAMADTGIVLGEYSAFDFGTVECVSFSVKCPKCGEADTMWYEEYPVLNAAKVNNAEAINGILKGDIDKAVAAWEVTAAEAAERLAAADECDHGLPNYTSDEVYVAGISMIDGRYLCVDYVSDHMPSDGGEGVRDFQRVFDTESGEEVEAP